MVTHTHAHTSHLVIKPVEPFLRSSYQLPTVSQRALCLFSISGLKIISPSSVAGDAKDKDISWFSPNGEKLTPNQQRISVVWNDDSSSTLTIYNANIDDAGIYKCVVTAEDGTESEATVNVKIFRKTPFLLLLYSLTSPLAGKTTQVAENGVEHRT